MMGKQRIINCSIMAVFALLLFFYLFLTEEKQSYAKEKKNTDVVYGREEYIEKVPFVNIGPDWGEDKIDFEKIYHKIRSSLANLEIESENQGEYDNIAFANVDDYVNVRTMPSTEGEVVGRIYDGSVAEILETAGDGNDWYKITSGNVNGYIKAEFFLRGEEAAEVMDRYIIQYAEVKADYLNVRTEPTTESVRIGLITEGEKVKLLEDIGDWVQIQYTEEEKGFVSSRYVTLTEEFLYAQTLAEIEESERQKKEELQKREELEKHVDEGINEAVFFEEQQIQEIENSGQDAMTVSVEGIREQIVSYAMQYQGNKYVSAGKSLAGGTDCSGFTCFIYADFGYSISRTPQGQYTSGGRSIAYEEIQPGDIICYSSNGGKSCTHVALYIGDGQIIHSANSRKGVIVQNADYDRIIGVRNILD